MIKLASLYVISIKVTELNDNVKWELIVCAYQIILHFHDFLKYKALITLLLMSKNAKEQTSQTIWETIFIH